MSIIEHIINTIKTLIITSEYISHEKKFIGSCILDALDNGWIIKKIGNNYKLRKMID